MSENAGYTIKRPEFLIVFALSQVRSQVERLVVACHVTVSTGVYTIEIILIVIETIHANQLIRQHHWLIFCELIILLILLVKRNHDLLQLFFIQLDVQVNLLLETIQVLLIVEVLKKLYLLKFDQQAQLHFIDLVFTLY